MSSEGQKVRDIFLKTSILAENVAGTVFNTTARYRQTEKHEEAKNDFGKAGITFIHG